MVSNNISYWHRKIHIPLSAPRPGEHIFLIGYPASRATKHLSVGEVGKSIGSYEGSIHSSFSESGSSGGPIVSFSEQTVGVSGIHSDSGGDEWNPRGNFWDAQILQRTISNRMEKGTFLLSREKVFLRSDVTPLDLTWGAGSTLYLKSNGVLVSMTSLEKPEKTTGETLGRYAKIEILHEAEFDTIRFSLDDPLFGRMLWKVDVTLPEGKWPDPTQ